MPRVAAAHFQVASAAWRPLFAIMCVQLLVARTNSSDSRQPNEFAASPRGILEEIEDATLDDQYDFSCWFCRLLIGLDARKRRAGIFRSREESVRWRLSELLLAVRAGKRRGAPVFRKQSEILDEAVRHGADRRWRSARQILEKVDWQRAGAPAANIRKPPRPTARTGVSLNWRRSGRR
jgi:hypothetical protein